MVVLVIGSKGQLGNEIKSIVKSGESEIGQVFNSTINSKFVFMDVEEVNIVNFNQVNRVLTKVNPDVVINCAAFTNVDECEVNEDLAFKINAIGPRNLAIVCEKISSKLVQVSTDYVFPGIGSKLLREYDETRPYSVYGKTKLMGENFVRDFCSKYFIIRTAWLYGYIGKNFVYTMIKLAKEKECVNVVNDQRGNPTHANDLAYHILNLIQTNEYGIYHCTGKGECTWYEFASEIIKLSGEKCKVNPCTSEEFKTLARRPKYSSLDNMMLRCTIGDKMRDWKEALNSFMENIK